jgi:hypothetical protein
MKITNTLILKSAFLLVLGCTAGCQPNTTDKNTGDSPTNQKTANTVQTENKTVAANNTNQTENTKTENDDSAKSGSLATPTEAYKFAYAARQNKDTEGLKRVLSKDALEFFSMMSEPGEPINKALLKMTETPQAATDESRNEKINGSRATLEYPDAQGKWKTMDFVKEDGDWKITIPKADETSPDENKKF